VVEPAIITAMNHPEFSGPTLSPTFIEFRKDHVASQLAASDPVDASAAGVETILVVGVELDPEAA
jgi:hypothetical protein